MSTVIVKDGVAVYGPGVVLRKDFADGGRFRDPTVRQDNAQQIAVSKVPQPFIGGCYAYSEGGLHLIPEKVSSLPLPESVTVLQALLAIDVLGYSEIYEAWANDASRTFAEKAFRDKALNWERSDPLFNTVADDLGFSEDDKDTFFKLAQTL